jgi:hypothetical protein
MTPAAGQLRRGFAAGYCSALAGTRRPGTDLDDWFAEPERGRVPAEPAPPQSPPPENDDDRGEDWDDDWLEQGDAPHRRGTGASLLDTLREWRALVVLVGLAVLLLVGLLAGGVFSSGRTARPPSPTTAPTVASTTAAHRTVSTPKTKTTATAVAPTPSPTITMNPGDRGPEVTVLQKALASLGYAVGTPDGVYGTATQRAVAQFQTAAHLTSDGVFGPATLAALAGALNGP